MRTLNSLDVQSRDGEFDGFVLFKHGSVKLLGLALIALLLVPVFADSLAYKVDDGRNQMNWEGKAHGETIHGHTPQVKGQMVGNPKDITDHPQIQIQADLASMQ